MTITKDTISAASIYKNELEDLIGNSIASNTIYANVSTTSTGSFDIPTYSRINSLEEKIMNLEKMLDQKERQVTMLLEILNAHLGKQV